MATYRLASHPSKSNTNRFDVVNSISYLTAAFVFVLAGLAFILSYSSLRHLAAANGYTGWLAYLWPLMLDFAMIVFSLAILRGNLRGESTRYAWGLTIAFAAMATVANVLDVEAVAVALDVATAGYASLIISAAVKALAPLALVLSFELLMSMIRAEIRRAESVQSLADIAAQTVEARAALARVEAESDRRRTDAESELAALTEKIERQAERLDQLKADEKSFALGKMNGDLSNANAARANSKDAAIAAMIAYVADNPNASYSEIGDAIGRAKGTVGEYARELESDGVLHRNGNGWEVLNGGQR